MERMGKEAVVFQFKVLVRNLLGRHKSHESKDWQCFGSDLNRAPSGNLPNTI